MNTMLPTPKTANIG